MNANRSQYDSSASESTSPADHQSDDHIADSIERLAQRSDVAEVMRDFYRRVDSEIAAKSPRCTNRGECCNFGRYGHRLYVTPIELGVFRRAYAGDWRRATVSEGSCPWHIDGVCSAREHRPLGCRVFFCDPDAAHWQNAFYEAKLAELKQQMDQLGIPYRYQEWLSVLASLADPAGDLPAQYETAAGRPEQSCAEDGIDHPLPRAIQLKVVKEVPARPI